MHPILFKLGPLTFYSYGFFYALAFLVGILTSIYFAKKEGMNSEIILDLALYVIISAILGARLFYVLGQWEQFKDQLLEIIMIQKGGLVFLGGLILSLITIFLYARRKNLSLLKLFDALSPGATLGYALGRIGCFLNGCCFGLPTKLPWGMVFSPESLAGFYFPDQHLHPTQLYASFAMSFAFLLLVIIYRRKSFDGQIFFFALIFYSLYRFLNEFLRYSPIHWVGLTPAQWLVIPLFLLGSWGILFLRKNG